MHGIGAHLAAAGASGRSLPEAFRNHRPAA